MRPITSGSYCLILYASEQAEIAIGKLGIITFQPGYYVYIGSALYSQNIIEKLQINSSSRPDPLLKRISRHMKPAGQKKFHWHIDYLLAVSNDINNADY